MAVGDVVDVYEETSATYVVPIKEYCWLRYDVVSDSELSSMLGLCVSRTEDDGAVLIAADATHEYRFAARGEARRYRCVAVSGLDEKVS